MMGKWWTGYTSISAGIAFMLCSIERLSIANLLLWAQPWDYRGGDSSTRLAEKIRLTTAQWGAECELILRYLPDRANDKYLDPVAKLQRQK
jgi:hypothetical protein